MLPPSRQLLAHVYLLAAGLTGAIVGYTVGRVDALIYRDAPTVAVDSVAETSTVSSFETSPNASPIHTVTALINEPSAQLQITTPAEPAAPANNINPAVSAPAPVKVISITTDPEITKAPDNLNKSSDVSDPPLDDLERAARRLDERARTADRLGDPKLADLWRNEAAKLRATRSDRLEHPNAD